MNIFLKYHMTDPEIYYQQEDIWEFPVLQRPGEEPLLILPFFMTLNLINEDRFEFMTLSAVNPKGRDNLRALVVAGSDPPNYGKLFVYNFPKGQLVYGPSQIEALISQDTIISQQFTLWGQMGSEVARGKMIILPIGHRIIYIQPIYMRAAGRLNIPELKRVIVSQGDVVVMQETLEEAFAELQNQTQMRAERIKKRFLQTRPQGGAPEGLPIPGEAPALLPEPEEPAVPTPPPDAGEGTGADPG
jgi:uncharacterized membrane protein (UPF0182 family)